MVQPGSVDRGLSAGVWRRKAPWLRRGAFHIWLRITAWFAKRVDWSIAFDVNKTLILSCARLVVSSSRARALNVLSGMRWAFD